MAGAGDLDQFGSWQDDPDDGPTWYPSNVQEGWVPYYTGYWTWIGPWGWTWIDALPGVGPPITMGGGRGGITDGDGAQAV